MKRTALLLLLCTFFLLSSCEKPQEVEIIYNVNEQFTLAEKLMTEGNYEETILILEQVLEVEPANVRGYLRLSDVYLLRGDEDKALELLQRGLELTGDAEIEQRIQGMTQNIEGIIDVSTNGQCVLLVDDIGDVYWCGALLYIKKFEYKGYGIVDYSTTPQKIHGLSNIQKVIANDSAYFAISDTNDLYYWGTSQWYINHEEENERRKDMKTPRKVMTGVKDIIHTGDSSFLILKTDGVLFSRGTNEFGELGTGREYEREIGNYYFVGNMRGAFEEEKVLDNIKKIIIYASYTQTTGPTCFAISEEHDLYVWGYMGMNVVNGIYENKCYNRPQLLFQNINDAVATYQDLFLIDTDGQLSKISMDSIFNENNNMEKFKTSLLPLKRLESGGRHIIMQDAIGTLYSAGFNNSGQLGIREETDGDYHKTYMPLNDKRIYKIAAGGSTSYSILESGELLAWGNNSDGQLGNGRMGIQKNAEEPTLAMQNVERVFAYKQYGYAVNAENKLYRAGYTTNTFTKMLDKVDHVTEDGYIITKDYCLYESNTETEYNKIGDNIAFYEEEIRDENTGLDATYFIVDEQNILWGWGDNFFGELGIGEISKYGAPIEEPTKIMEDVKKVTCCGGGANETLKKTTIILTYEGEVYLCGSDIVSNYGENGVNLMDPKMIATNIRDFYHNVSGLMLLSNDGILYYLGLQNDLYFQDHSQISHEKTMVSIMQNVKKIDKNILLTTDGDVYIYGNDIFVDLVVKKHGEWNEELSCLGEEKLICKYIMGGAIDVASSNRNTMNSYYVVKENGDLYTWGNNLQGQLGIGDAGADENIFEIKIPE